MSADTVAVTCVPTARVPGPALVAGDTYTFPWLNTCSDWELRVFLGSATEPCWTPTRFRLRFGSEPDAGSGSSSSSGSGSGSGIRSPGYLPLQFTMQPVNSAQRLANTAAAAEARALAFEQVQAARQRIALQNEAARIVMHGLGLDSTFGQALEDIGVEAGGSWATIQAALNASASVLANGASTDVGFVNAVEEVGSEDLAAAAALLNTTANFEAIVNATIAQLAIAEAASDAALETLNNYVNEVAAVVAAVNTSEVEAAFAAANDSTTYNMLQAELAAEEARLRVKHARRKVDDAVLTPWDIEMMLLAFFVCGVIELIRTRCCAVWRPLCWRSRLRKAPGGPSYRPVDVDTSTVPGLQTVRV